MPTTKKRRPPTKAPDEEEWNSRKTILRELFFNKNLTQLMMCMEREHDFVASKNQYERRFKEWGFRKNLTSDEWKLVLAEWKRREEICKESEVTLNGVLVPKSRVEKEETRYALSELARIYASYRNSSLPDGICVSTPSPHALETLGNIGFHNLPSFVLMDLLSSSGGFYPTPIPQATPSKTRWSPLIPPAQIPNIANSEEATFPSYLTKVSTSIERQSTIYENILPGLSEHSISRTQSEKKDLILREVEAFMLERYEGEIADRTNKILDSSNPENVVQFTVFVSTLSSNNLIENIAQQKAFLEWIRHQNRPFLHMMFSIKTPALQACLEALLNYAVEINDSATFELLFKADESKQWYRGRREMLLLAAVRFNLVDIVCVLCEEGTDVNCQLTLTPWAHGPESPLVAATTTAMVQVLLDAGADVKSESHSRHSCDTLTCQAIERGQVKLAEFLLGAGAYFDPMQRLTSSPDLENRGTQLAHAIYWGNIAAVKLLLKLGAVCIDGPICYSDDRRFWATEIQLAAFCGNEEIVVAILNQPSGRSCISTGRYRWSPLRDASMEGHVKIVELLIAAGADVNAGKETSLQDFRRGPEAMEPSTPLIAAVSRGHKEVVELLLRESVNVNGLDFSEHGTSALEAAENLGHPKHTIALLLICHGAVKYPKRDGKYQAIELCFAVRNNNLERVRSLVAEGIDVGHVLDAAPAQLDTMTCSNIISIFLKVCGDKINTSGPSSKRPALQIAMEANQPGVARRLIFAGASLSTPWSYEGGCPLDCAIKNRDFPMISLLVTRGARIEQRFAFSNLDILFGVDYNLKFINHLVENGLNLPLEEWYASCLQRLLATNDLNIATIRLLIENGADVNSAADDHGTPLQNAVRANASLSIIQLLVEKGADINAEPRGFFGPYGITALQAAIVPWSSLLKCNLAPNMETIQYLLENGADINASPADHYGITALQGAAIQGYLKIAHMLLERGADPNAAGSQQGRTALEGAAENGRLDMVQLLLNAGADAKESAANFAEKYNHFVIADLIRDNIKAGDYEDEGEDEDDWIIPFDPDQFIEF